MKRPRSVPRNSLSRLFQEAAEAWRKQEYQQTIDLLQRAARLDPANPSVLLDLGRAYGLRYDYPSAERCLEKAVLLSPKKSTALAEAGTRGQEFGNYPLATAFFERALREDETSLHSLVTLAELHERHARLDTALDLIQRALHHHPGHPRALIVLARLLRLTNQLSPGESILRGLIASPTCDTSTRIRAWYELGNILDRQGNYSAAMESFLEAKALQRPAAVPFLQVLHGIQERVLEMKQTITTEVLHRWGAAATDLQPLHRFAVLCGHPRSGTTLLEQMLDSHPDVVSAEETHILHDEAYLPLSRGFPQNASILEVLDSAPRSLLRQSRENYFRYTGLFINQGIGSRLLVDKNPALNVLIPAVVRIFPEAKFLISLRDPRDVCLSCFMQPLTLNPVSSAYLSLDGTIKQYCSVMGFWRSILPKLPNPWTEVRYEEFVADTSGVSRRLLEFLEIPWKDEVLRFQDHARSKPVRSPSYAEVVKPVYKQAIGRWRNYQKYFEPYLEKLQPLIQELGYN